MNLRELSDFIKQKREEFKTSVEDKARELDFKEIAQEIGSYPVIFPSDEEFSDFMDGREIGLRSSDEYYTVRITPDSLIVEAPSGYELKDFHGDKVRALYERLAERIISERDAPS